MLFLLIIVQIIKNDIFGKEFILLCQYKNYTMNPTRQLHNRTPKNRNVFEQFKHL